MTDNSDNNSSDDAPPTTTTALEIIYGTARDDPIAGLMAAFSKLIADAGTVNLELLDTTIVAGDDNDSDQQVAVAFEVVVGYEPPFERAETVSTIAVEQDPSDNDNGNGSDSDSDSGSDSNTDIELVADLQGATEAVVIFHPQIWKDDYAVTGDETETYTLPIEDVVTEDGDLPEDSTYESDALARHENAPKRAREWQGPFYVSVGEVR